MAFITFIHGIANKPISDELHRIWINALLANDGLDLEVNGVDSQMVYWADVMYDKPVPAGQSMESLAEESVAGEAGAVIEDVDMSWMANMSAEETKLVTEVTAEVMTKAAAETVTPLPVTATQADGTKQESVTFERIPLPWFMKEPMMKMLLRDVHHYLFNVEFKPRPAGPTFRVRDEIRSRLISALNKVTEAQRPHIVISHSMGTVVAYDCIKRVADCPRLDGFITIGSPLGLDEVQDKLRSESGGPGWTREDGFPSEKVTGRWGNVYDRFDPVVGFDPQFANDFQRNGQRVVEDNNEQNFGRWRHDIVKYLSGANLRKLVAEMVGI
ncbi:MAG TPA: hypothetical protein VEK57_17545 [Thermoanaerobaculia bacterium]|nr:hypothetical protein [Thermoanaerobaculia bacterium]